MSLAVDVNPLLYASDQGSPFHAAAVRFLAERAAGPDLFYLTWPTVMSYLRMATHPRIFTHPLTPEEAGDNMEDLLGRPHVRVLAEEEGFWEIYRGLVRLWPARANQVPDAHLAALLRQHGVRRLCTNDSDFRRFEFLEIVNPFDAR